MNDKTREQLRAYLVLTESLLDSMNVVLKTDSDTLWKHAGYRQYILRYNALIEAVFTVDPIMKGLINSYDSSKLPGIGATTTIQQKELSDSIHADLSILRGVLQVRIGLKADQTEALKNFLRAKLRKAVLVTPEKEVEVQNAVEQILIGRGLEKGIDYGRETGRVKVSIKEVVPDFVFYKIDMALEVKLSKLSVAARLGTSLGDQRVQARRLLRDAIYRLGRGSWDRC
jgi:hypothetical protein